MKEFKKLALVSAIAALPMSGFAMEAMQDAALADVTGQDGISISLQSNLTAGLKIHDTDGLTAISGQAGALVINGFSITRAATTDSIDIDIDADGNTAAPVLNVAVTLPNNLSVALGQLGVAESGRDNTTPAWSTTNTVSSVVNLGTVTLGATTLNIQLANEPQGNMISLNTTITNGVSITGFSVSDAGGAITGGALSADITVVDNGGSNLTLNTGIDLGADGMHIGLGGLGGVGGIDVRMANVSLDGGTTQLGDIELVGLNLTGDLIINGH